jgi:hypothetical protein
MVQKIFCLIDYMKGWTNVAVQIQPNFFFDLVAREGFKLLAALLTE